MAEGEMVQRAASAVRYNSRRILAMTAGVEGCHGESLAAILRLLDGSGAAPRWVGWGPFMCALLLLTGDKLPFVWNRIALDLHVHAAVVPFQKGNVADWIVVISRIPFKRQQMINAGIIFYFWWYIWKERNRRVFDQEECSHLQVV
jgi:hypothetical protein